MKEEEKQAIETLKEINQAIKYRPMLSIPSDTKLFDTILNIIKKQQKEIEELKEKNASLQKEIKLMKSININDNYISKDKIKEKLEELKAMEISQDIYTTDIEKMFEDLLKE